MNEVNELCGKIMGIVNDIEFDIDKIKGLIDLFDIFAGAASADSYNPTFSVDAFYSLRDYGYILYDNIIEKSEKICEVIRNTKLSVNSDKMERN